jgi:glycosyltransferase involved in cell wall biosynthesis
MNEVGRPNLTVAALIPAYNEAARVGAVVRGAAEHLPVVVVDDGSADRTATEAEKAGATVLRHPTNRGKGAALETGFRWAAAGGYDAMVTLDADGQHDPGEIPAFLEAYAAGAGDLIIGYRDFRAIPLVRRIANTTGRLALSWALRQPIRDNQSGYRLVTRPVWEVLQPTVGGFELEVEMIAQTIWAGLRLGWVPIRTIYGGERSHIRPVSHTVRFFRLVWRLRKTGGEAHRNVRPRRD